MDVNSEQRSRQAAEPEGGQAAQGAQTARTTPPPTRARDQRVLAGVCGGLARRTGVDAIVYRVAFGVLGLAGGVGVAIYGAAWVLLPRDDTGRSQAERWLRRRIDGPAVLAILVALLIVPGLLAPTSLGPPTLTLLVVCALALLAAHRRGVDLAGALRAVPGRLRFPPLPPEDAGLDPEPPTAEHQPGAAEWSGRPSFAYGTPAPEAAAFQPDSATLHYGTGAYGTAPQAEAAYPPYADPGEPPYGQPPYGQPSRMPYASGTTPFGPGTTPFGPGTTSFEPGTTPFGADAEDGPLPADDPYLRPEAPPRRRGGAVLTLITVGAAFVVAGVLAAVSVLGTGPPATVILAAAVTVIGLGLLAGARYGRGRPLIGVGLVASLLLVAATAITPTMSSLLGGGVGDVAWRPTGAVTKPYHLGAGEATLDLTGLTGSRSYDFTATVDMGKLHVRVPRGADVTVRAHTGLGDITVDEAKVASGPGAEATRTWRGDGAGPSIRLRLNVNLGEVEVHRVSP